MAGVIIGAIAGAFVLSALVSWKAKYFAKHRLFSMAKFSMAPSKF